jgi:hypothetical protein
MNYRVFQYALPAPPLLEESMGRCRSGTLDCGDLSPLSTKRLVASPKE